MICFLTGNPFLEDGSGLNPANGFVDALLNSLPAGPVRGVFVASSPDAPDINDFYAAEQKSAFEAGGIAFETYDILDRRSADRAAEWVAAAQMIILTGGHVPTQNRFFHDIGLKELLKSYKGVLIGISAGTMNAAETVYAQPELEGEAIDPTYRRFLPGLGLTKAMLLPHFDGDMDCRLDGLRIWDDVTFPDSMGRRFYAVPDGSYLFIQGGKEELRGEVYLVADGEMRPFCKKGRTVRL